MACIDYEKMKIINRQRLEDKKWNIWLAWEAYRKFTVGSGESNILRNSIRNSIEDCKQLQQQMEIIK